VTFLELMDHFTMDELVWMSTQLMQVSAAIYIFEDGLIVLESDGERARVYGYSEAPMVVGMSLAEGAVFNVMELGRSVAKIPWVFTDGAVVGLRSAQGYRIHTVAGRPYYTERMLPSIFRVWEASQRSE